MIRAIKAVSSERGRDPRDYTLFAFGGNGPLFAATMAQALGMTRILVPPSPGLFSAFGILYAEVEHHYAQTLRRTLYDANPADLETAWKTLEEKARTQLDRDGFPTEQQRLRRAANMHYKGQIFELSIPLADGPIDCTAMAEAFGEEHLRTYGHRAGSKEPVELVNVELIGQGVPEHPRIPERLQIAAAERVHDERTAYFGTEDGWLDIPVFGRDNLTDIIDGPAIIEEYDATCLVPPGTQASIDAHGNIVLQLGQSIS